MSRAGAKRSPEGPHGSGQDFKAGVYWRKSMWNGRACVPVILALHAGRVSLKDQSGVVFDVPSGEVSANFTSWGTMVATVGGKKYAIVGSGAEISKRFDEAQFRELDAAGANAGPTPAWRGQIPGAYAVGVAGIERWQSVFASSGVQFSAKPAKGPQRIYKGMAWALAIGIVLIIALLIIQHTTS